MSFRDVVDAYMRDPSPGTWATLKTAILTDKTYDPSPTETARAAELVNRGDHFEALRVIDMKMPGLFFSPSAHTTQRHALEASGRHDAAQRASLFARAAYVTIDESGDGTADNPWQVLRVSDQYDYLSISEMTSVGQRLVEQDTRILDAHTLSDGNVVYFEMEMAR